jgi:hypothetical protein
MMIPGSHKKTGQNCFKAGWVVDVVGYNFKKSLY